MEVNTDKTPIYPRVLDELLPEACHVDAGRENNWIDSDHSRLKAQLRPILLKRLLDPDNQGRRDQVQNVRRGHYELATDNDPHLRLSAAFTELALAI
ncbi:putative transposase [Parafrankia sp. EAN1pec]|nr:putative transposase [Frankia sp. EAN1pec]